MRVLEGYEPERALHYFEEICSIPHGSRNTDAISRYCVKFAQDNNLEYHCDEKGNVVIRREASKGYENAPVVIMQGHIDMVCEKDEECDIDFEKDPLRLKVLDGILSAEGTTLGGDDGVAVSFMMAVLENQDIKAPELECIFTVDEEIGMLGAQAFDMSKIKGRLMINLDHGEEGSLLVGCAGGVTAMAHLPIEREGMSGLKCILDINELVGGHSGEMIHKQRGNANVILGRVLNELSEVADVGLVSVSGGLKDNAIPRSAEAVMLIDAADKNDVIKCVESIAADIRREHRITDPDMNISVSVSDECVDADVLTVDSKIKTIGTLCNLPGGVQKMSLHIPGLVQSSLNLGILKTEGEEIKFSFSVRSDIGTEKREMCRRMESLLKMVGGYMTYDGDYPAWEMNSDSMLQKIAVKAYRDLFDDEMSVGTIHAGLECGLFSDALDGLDCISIGPNMYDIHTPKETLDLMSMARYWDYLLTILERIN